MGCPSPRQLIDLKNGNLTMSEHKKIEAHVISCDKCSREYLALESLDKRGDEQNIKEAMKHVTVKRVDY